MNSVKYQALMLRIKKAHITLYLCILLIVFIQILGCSDQITLPSTEQLIEFENAAPFRPTVDMDSLAKAKISGSSYRVIPDEVIELTMPAILRVVTTDESIGTDKDTQYICRINERGTITLPVVGEIEVAGKTLAQIESAIINAYYPKYALTLPSVFARVLEYKTAKVSISGAVVKPGIYSLRSDQMSLVALIMQAEGIIDEGAAVIRITHSEDEVGPDTEEIPEELNDRGIEQVTKHYNTELIKSSKPYYSSDDLDVQLSFKQASKQSTIGIMTIICNQKVLLAERMDITSDIERLVLLKQLSWREPRISITDVEHKLCALSERLNPEFDKTRKNTIAYVNSIFNVRNGINKNGALNQKTSGQELNVIAKTAQQSFVQTELDKQSNNSHYSSTGRNISRNLYTNAVFGINYTEQNQNTEPARNEDIVQTLNIDRNQESEEKFTSNGNLGSESIVLPVDGFNIPFADVVLQDGDSVIVERLEQPLFSVIGLVNSPGNFQYPPNVQYNIMQAIAFAGGFNQAAEPRYATVYRLKPNGTIVHAIFELVNIKNSSQLTDSLSTHIKPGDIVSVEHTPRTRTNVFLDRVFRINMGTYFSLNEVWDNGE